MSRFLKLSPALSYQPLNLPVMSRIASVNRELTGLGAKPHVARLSTFPHGVIDGSERITGVLLRIVGQAPRPQW